MMFLGSDDDVSLNPWEQWPDAARASSSSASYQSWDDDYLDAARTQKTFITLY